STGSYSNPTNVCTRTSTCGINKARGATCHSSSVIEPVVTQIMAHEVGHQLAASHTWNFCPGSEDQRTSTTAFEPGGGSTIMSYAGLCGSENNVQFSSDEYYHVSSINQVFDFTREGDGSTCGTEIQTNNNTPDVTLPYEDGFYIPISTPFRLKAEGSDQDGDDITYCWEQYNSGPAAIMGMPTGNGASFRSFPPTENPERIFPTLNRIISNTNHVTEVLPTYTRNLKFRCTVRDDQFQNGGISWAEMSFEATASAGPFRVEFPNTMETLEVGSWQEITWDVANTDNDLVDCHFVNIRLSTDGGQTYPISLAENVPNDGAQFVTIPNAVTVDARVMIEAANNIFFDISNADSEIVLPADPTVFFSASPALQTVCLPDAVTIDIATEALQGFTGDISFAVNNLPDGAVPNFSANPTTPDAGTDLSIDMSQVTANGEFDVEIVLTGDNLTDPISRIVTLNIVNSDFSALALSAPANGETGVAELPDFSWSDLPNVDFVDIEIATNPSFEDGSIVETASNINLSTYTPSTILEKNTPYFWRIRPNNACGAGDWSIPFAFQTETLSCANFSNTDVINITAQGTPTVQSKINLASGGAISDVNITKIKGQHDLVKHLEVRLISPEQTSVVLFRDLCGNTTLFDVALDDSAPEELPCPPIGGDTYLPQEPLEAFNTENSQGEWTLEAEVIDEAGNGGAIQEWGLQICSSVSLNGPFIVNNETLAVKPNEGNPITSEFLLADDNDNSPEELTFTIVTAPVNGSLFLLGNKLEVGSTFRQATINANNLRYVNDINGNADSDAFTFTVSDGAGGWVGVPAFNIDIDDNATTGLNDPEIADRIQVFPNPTDKQLTVLFDEVAQGDLNLRLINVQGQLARELNYSQASNRIQVNISDLASGVYVLQLSFGQATVTKKVTIQH
ncbi:MAG: cadherin-like domain-containing protein, partial [Bacteroidota bacterium]